MHPASVRWRERYNSDPAFRLKQVTKCRARKVLKRSGITLIDDGTVEVDVFTEHSECPYCGVDMPINAATIDHMQPLTKGGAHSRSNVIACCFRCNTKKGNKDFSVWLASLPPDRADVVREAIARRAS